MLLGVSVTSLTVQAAPGAGGRDLGASADERTAEHASMTAAGAERPAVSRESPGQTLRDLANSAYTEGRYEDALELLQRANVQEPYGLHEFNLGAVHDRMGHCEQARDHFEAYLLAARREYSPAVEDARQALVELYTICGRTERSDEAAVALREPPAESLELPPVLGALTVIPALPEPSPEAQRARGETVAFERSSRGLLTRRQLALCMLGTGAAAGVASGIAAVLVRRAEADTEALAQREANVTAREVDALLANGRRYQALSLGFGVASALLAGTGAALLVIDLSDQSALEVAVDGSPGLHYQRRF